MPTRATPESAGFTLYSCENKNIFSKTRREINTGVRVYLPKNTFGRIESKHVMGFLKLDTAGRIIDQNFEGSIKVTVINNGKKAYIVNRGDEIGQLIIQNIDYYKPINYTDQ